MGVKTQVMKIKRVLERAGFNVITDPRADAGWPCFHCGRKKAYCDNFTCCRGCTASHEKGGNAH